MPASRVSLHRGMLNGPDNRTTFYRATQAATALLSNQRASLFWKQATARYSSLFFENITVTDSITYSSACIVCAKATK